MSEIIIFGMGDIAQLAHFYFENDSQHNVVAFTVDKEYITAKEYCELPVIDFSEIENKYNPNNYKMFVAVSYNKMNRIRTAKVNSAKSKGFKLVSYISSKATIYPKLDHLENCFILEDNTIQPYAQIGSNVTLWSGNHIGHHSCVGSNSFISSHVVISGGVNIGKNCFIGVNATILDHVNISENTLIAAGALINKDTDANGVYIGMPAKKMKTPSDKVNI